MDHCDTMWNEYLLQCSAIIGGTTLKIGIIGMPQSGKTTTFSLLTNVKLGAGNKTNIAMGKIPDYRIDALSKLYNPKKTTHAVIEFVDLPGYSNGQGNNGRDFLGILADVDALILVIRAFKSDTVPAVNGIQPFGDFNQIQQELQIADWSLLETRLERMAKQRNKDSSVEAELEVLNKCREILEQDLPLRQLDLTQDEERLIRGYDFLTKKPLIVAVNLDEEQMRTDSYPEKNQLEQDLLEKNIPCIAISGQLEAEINELDENDAVLFMEELGIQEPGIARVARTVYRHLGLISFFTVGEDEVRAWTVREGNTAPEAAGKIHSDIERGFIRAEVVGYEELMEYGSIQKLKEKGLFRLEGKDYIVRDGDVMSFRFNV